MYMFMNMYMFMCLCKSMTPRTPHTAPHTTQTTRTPRTTHKSEAPKHGSMCCVCGEVSVSLLKCVCVYRFFCVDEGLCVLTRFVCELPISKLPITSSNFLLKHFLKFCTPVDTAAQEVSVSHDAPFPSSPLLLLPTSNHP